MINMLTNILTKQKIIAFIIVLGLALIALFQFGLGGKNTPVISPAKQSQTQPSEDEGIRMVSMKPENLEGATILPTQAIEVTFNKPLENAPEVKYFMDPEAPLKTELSGDRKTIKFIPDPPLKLGQGYTLVIKQDTKFAGKKTLGVDLHWAFATIAYRGI